MKKCLCNICEVCTVSQHFNNGHVEIVEDCDIRNGCVEFIDQEIEDRENESGFKRGSEGVLEITQEQAEAIKNLKKLFK